jgi:hypothetical protein
MPFSSGEFPFPQGTTALLDIRLPNSGKKFSRIAIKCRGCYDEKKDNLKYVNSLNLRLYAKGCMMRALALAGFAYAEDKTPWCRIWPHLIGFRFWSELCSDCLEERGHIDRFVGWKLASSGTKVYFPDDKDAPARIHYRLCGCEKDISRNNAINSYMDYRAACRKHAGQILDSHAQNGNGHVNAVAEKRGRGRTPKPPEVKQAELERRKAEFEYKIRELGKSLPRHAITRAAIADEYAGDDGEIPEESTIGKWVREFYGRGVSVPAAVDHILTGSHINSESDREIKSPI